MGINFRWSYVNLSKVLKKEDTPTTKTLNVKINVLTLLKPSKEDARIDERISSPSFSTGMAFLKLCLSELFRDSP